MDPALSQEKWHSRARTSSSSANSDADGDAYTYDDATTDLVTSPPLTYSASTSEPSSPVDINVSMKSPSFTYSQSSSTLSPADAAAVPPGHQHPSSPSDFNLDLSAFFSEISAGDHMDFASTAHSCISSNHYAHPSPIPSPSGDRSTHGDAHCGCLANSPEYYAMLELSLRLRKAADTLRLSTRHRSHSECALLQRISTWDALTT